MTFVLIKALTILKLEQILVSMEKYRIIVVIFTCITNVCAAMHGTKGWKSQHQIYAEPKVS